MIPISKPNIGEEELHQVSLVFKSGWLGMGSVVFEFEKALKSYLNAKHVIAVNTGTSALHIALSALDIKQGDEVIVPSLTYIATVQAILACGAIPKFCDIEENTLNIDLQDVKKQMNSQVRAIIPVHYGGLPCNMDALLKYAHENGIFVIEDAAHAFGSTYNNKKIGSFGDITCFSFDPIKNITCGEGGCVALSNDELAQKIITQRILGIDKDTWQRYKHQRSWFYNVVMPGFRYHMSNINAAIGLVQLQKVDQFIKKRKEIIQKYDQALSDVEGIELLYRDYEQTAPFNYIIKIKHCLRDKLLNFLNNNAIGAGVHYIPNHFHPLFKKYKTHLHITEKVFEQILSLPLYTDLTGAEIAYVITKIQEFYLKKDAQ